MQVLLTTNSLPLLQWRTMQQAVCRLLQMLQARHTSLLNKRSRQAAAY
jgi:hypothetical protein